MIKFDLKKLKKEEQIKHKEGGRKKIIKIRTEINEIEKCPSRGEGISKLWYIHAIEYYTTLRKNY